MMHSTYREFDKELLLQLVFSLQAQVMGIASESDAKGFATRTAFTLIISELMTSLARYHANESQSALP